MSYSPELCVWETTLACNLTCRHCGSSAGKARSRELDTDEALNLLDALAELGTKEITFSGGEFFVRADWRRLLERARALGLGRLVVSNGLAITAKVAEDLARLGVSCVSLSIDGGPTVHDQLRPLNAGVPTEHSGPGEASSFVQLGWAMANLKAARVPVAAITQVSRANLAELPRIAETLADREVEGWQLQMTNSMGRAQGLGARGVPILEPQDLPELYAFIRRIQDQGRLRCLAADCIGYFGPDEPLLRSLEQPNDNFWQGCQAGLRVIGITSDGGVKGCLSLPDAFLEGNLRERPLRELWADPKAFPYNRQFDVRSLTGACQGCAFGRICRAGCHSFAATAQGGDISRYDYCIRTLAPGAAPRSP